MEQAFIANLTERIPLAKADEERAERELLQLRSASDPPPKALLREAWRAHQQARSVRELLERELKRMLQRRPPPPPWQEGSCYFGPSLTLSRMFDSDFLAKRSA